MQVDRFRPRRGRQRHQVDGLVGHRLRVAGDPSASEERLDESALAQPAFVLAVQQPVAESPAHLLVEAVVLAVAIGLARQYPTHRIGVKDGVQGGAQPGRADDEPHDVTVRAASALVGAQHIALKIERRADQGAPRGPGGRVAWSIMHLQTPPVPD